MPRLRPIPWSTDPASAIDTTPHLNIGSIPAGFDAIVEIGLDLLDEHVAWWTRQTGLADVVRVISYDASMLSADVRALVRDVLDEKSPRPLAIEVVAFAPTVATLQSTRAPIPIPPAPPVDAPDRPGPPPPAPPPAPLPVAELHCPVAIRLVIDEGRQRPIVLARGQGVIAAHLEVAIDAAHLSTFAYVELGGHQPTFDAPSPQLAVCLADPVVAAQIRSALAPLVDAPAVHVTPVFALAGDLGVTQVVATGLAQRFHVRPVVTVATGAREVLALCVDTSGPPWGSLDDVIAFVASGNFAYYVSGTMASKILRQRWIATSARVFESDVALQIQQGDDPPQNATARVRVTWGSSPLTVSLIATDDTDDAVRFEARSSTQLLSLRDDRGNDLGPLGDLGKPDVEPLVVWAYLFVDSQPAVSSLDVKQFFAKVLRPIALPMIEPYAIATAGGVTSAPADLIYVTGTYHLAAGAP